MKRKRISNSYFAFTQAFLLVMSLFAFTFIISEVNLISGTSGSHPITPRPTGTYGR